jgi:tRNA pseudouridine38-40 synthase
VNAALEVEAMQEGARHLLGHHDFTSFRSSICQAASPMKTRDLLAVERRGQASEIRAKARSFLHHQVRNMVGTLKLVGEGKWSPEDVAKALAAKDRSAAGPTAPPDGLYLTEVGY